MRIFELIEAKEEEFRAGDVYDWNRFDAFLAEDHPEIVADPNFHATNAAAKLGWIP
jgi:hypothetical protein